MPPGVQPGMRALILPLSTLLSGVGLLVLGVGLLFSVLGLRAGLADFSTVATGLEWPRLTWS